jgi:hexokinase
MKEIDERVKEFYKNYGMDYEDLDIGEGCERFIEEIEKGLRGEETSLQMLPTYIEVDRNVPVNKKVIVLDAGGTNFRVATVSFTEEYRPVI